MFNNVYKDKKVLVTGATGFKGSWLVLWLEQLGAKVCGYALEPETTPSMYNCLNINDKVQTIIANILDKAALQKTFDNFKPEIVFHLAAQPLVRKSYFEPLLTYETNIIGTLNVLIAAKNCESVQAFVNVTTDKCYENKETGVPFKEDDPMGGYDIYSSSKACSEILSSSFRRSFLSNTGFSLATARAGNVIGGGDWAQDRLIPDCVRAINADETVVLRNPSAVRPWQHVLEPLSGYLLLGQKLVENGKKYSQAFNFGPKNNSILTVEKVAKLFSEFYGKGDIVVNKDNSLHEAKLLMLDIKKAETYLGWKPVLTAEEAISYTAEWYKMFYDKKSMYEHTLSQIEKYMNISRKIMK